ncbi:hypothetical protein, partial [Citrobacter youngae]|uniref:hypothetical protein n=1 Tax=Citrobacter youngae TaxID=133448 RepID=UPI00195328E6
LSQSSIALAMGSVVSIRTLDGRLLACNRNYLESLRMTREQARGTLLTDSDWGEGSKARLLE